MNMLSTFIKPMHKEGRRFVAISAGITAILFLLAWLMPLLTPLAWLMVGITIWVYYFFRDPKRYTPTRAGLIVSPADGIISLIEPAVPPKELGMGPEARTRVSVFMNVFNCHVNRAPIGGEIKSIAYRPGKFFNASLDKASVDNERNSLCIEIEDGRQIAVVQIAGLVARRIVCFANTDDSIQTGARFGLIRFGSRLDVYLPDGVQPMVSLGQTMVAGETVLADLHSEEAVRLARED